MTSNDGITKERAPTSYRVVLVLLQELQTMPISASLVMRYYGGKSQNDIESVYLKVTGTKALVIVSLYDF